MTGISFLFYRFGFWVGISVYTAVFYPFGNLLGGESVYSVFHFLFLSSELWLLYYIYNKISSKNTLYRVIDN